MNNGGKAHPRWFADARGVLAVLAMLSAATCGGGGTSNPAAQTAQPGATVSPSAVPFGNELVSTPSNSQTITLSNSGSGNLSIATVSLGGANPSDFSKGLDSCSANVLSPGGSCSVSLIFTPASTGNFTAALSFADSASNSPQAVSLTGTGTAPAITIGPTSLVFTNQSVASTSASQTVTATNTGSSALNFDAITVTGANPLDFPLTNDTCLNATLAPNASCTLNVAFAPAAAGSRSAGLNFVDNAPGSPQSLSLTGTGVQPAANFSASSLIFPSQVVATASAAQTVTLTNSGTVSLAVQSVSLAGTNPGDFIISSNTCQGATLPTNSTCSVGVEFQPAATGNRAASLSFTDSAAGSPQTVGLSGTGTAPSVQLSPGSLSFAAIATGGSSPAQAIMVQNTNSSAVAIAGISISGDFTQTNDCPNSLASGATCSVQVTFLPTTAGVRTGVLSLTYADVSGAQTLNLQGIGEGPLAGVYTQRYDNSGSGQNVTEDYLAPSNVTESEFGKLYSYPVDGQVYAQPLYMENVAIPNQGTHNVVFVATEHDSVYAFDADGLSTSPLWQTSFINASAGVTTAPSSAVYASGITNISHEVGITSTPVIDPTTGTLYVDALTQEATVPTCTSGCTYNYFHRLHALDVTTGAERFGGPVVITGSVAGTGYDNVSGTVTFNPLKQLQRPGLMLLNGTIYLAFGSYADQDDYHGWLFAYNASTLQQVAVFNTTPDGYRGAFWQSGAGLTADSNGYLYVITSNGDFTANTGGADYGDSVLKMQLVSGQFQVLDYFTPNDQATMNDNDLDLGSSPALILPDQPGTYPHLLATGGKDGRIWLLNRDNLGHDQSSDAGAVQVLPQIGSDRLFGGGSYWNGNLYFQETGEPLNQFTLANGLMPTSPTSSTPSAFSSSPDSSPVITSHGAQNGVLWMVLTDAANNNGPAVLYAFDPADVSNQLYDSTEAANARDQAGPAVRFVVPTVANGRVYVGTQTEVDVYGLLPQ